MLLLKKHAALLRWSLLTSGVMVSLGALKVNSHPHALILLCWCAVSLLLAFLSKNSTSKVIWLNLGAVLLTGGGVEGYLLWENESIMEDIRWERDFHKGGYDPTFEIMGRSPSHEVMGYAPKPNRKVSVRRYYKDQLLYDVVYTIDSDGLRIAPPVTASVERPCVLFYGGSFTFGSGLNDDEAFPYLVGVKTEGRYRVYNFGFHGYGPHQMLASLQRVKAKTVKDCSPRYLIYTALGDHLRRAVGLAPFDRVGPRYILNQDGKLISGGTFNAKQQVSFAERIGDQFRLSDSLIYQRALGKGLFEDDQINVFAAIVDAARRAFVAGYPGGEFHILLWGKVSKESSPPNKMFNALVRKGLTVHRIDQILPGYTQNKFRYLISKDEQHPNALANEMISDYVVEHIIRADPLDTKVRAGTTVVEIDRTVPEN